MLCFDYRIRWWATESYEVRGNQKTEGTAELRSGEIMVIEARAPCSWVKNFTLDVSDAD
jgi:hypothetical protein